MRDENWMLVEFYDEDAVELYDLSTDAREVRNVAEQQPKRVAAMRSALAAWRTRVGAQNNTPNPDFDAAKFRELYIEVDASLFDPAHADAAQWEKMWAWRKAMNAVLPNAGKARSAKKNK